MKLSNDTARCDGATIMVNTIVGPMVDHRVQCLQCLRRTAERGEYVWMMEPPQFVDGKCPMRIAPLGAADAAKEVTND